MTKIKCKKFTAAKLAAAQIATKSKLPTSPCNLTRIPEKNQQTPDFKKKLDRNSNTSSPTSSGVPSPEKHW